MGDGITYSFHIDFADGSNPYYHFPCSKEEHRKAIRKWRRNWKLTLIGKVDTLYFFNAQERTAREKEE